MGEPPKLTLAAESDPAELEKQQALRELGWNTSELAANLLRVMRGAGNPALLPQQIINLGEAILKVHETARAWAIWSAVEEKLQQAVPDYFGSHESEAALGSIAKGSLQYLASRLVVQRAQEASGRREMLEGIRELEQYHERQRAKWAAEDARVRALQRKPVVRKKRTARQKQKPSPKAHVASEPGTEAECKPSSTAEFMKARQRELRGES